MRSIVMAVVLLASVAPVLAAPASVKSDFCRKVYDEMASKPKFKAFALSSDGKVCNAVWGSDKYPTQRLANRAAVAGCVEKNERKCRLVGLK